MIKNIKLTFAYDGSKYSGMQTQKDKNSIQETIERAIERVCGRSLRLIIAGRTDAGVHAYAMVGNFLSPLDIPAKAYIYKLRMHLPDSIMIKDAQEVGLDFHARFSARSKSYQYIIYNGKFMHPSLNHIYTQVEYTLDIEKMQRAAKHLIGTHDFKAFSKYVDRPVNTVRKLTSLDIYKKENLIYFDFKAPSFLYNQIRVIVGSLVDVGRGHRSVQSVVDLLTSKDRSKAGMTYPAAGLYLLEIDY